MDIDISLLKEQLTEEEFQNVSIHIREEGYKHSLPNKLVDNNMWVFSMPVKHEENSSDFRQLKMFKAYIEDNMIKIELSE